MSKSYVEQMRGQHRVLNILLKRFRICADKKMNWGTN